MPKKSDIGDAASKTTQDELATELRNLTTLTPPEIKELFPTQVEQKEFAMLLRIVSDSTDENTRRAKLIEQINCVASAVIKIGKKFAMTI